MVEAVKQGFPQREIADAAYAHQCEVDAGERVVVGVNGYTEGDDGELELLRIDPELERKQIGRVQAVRAGREAVAVEAALAEVRAVAAGDGNLMPALLEAARARATEGELVETLQAVWGSYTEVPIF
jgi:methylmalonyl-CoA mutase, N-terminal domain